MKRVIFLILLALSFTSFSTSYHIGDDITLKISNLSKDDINSAFTEYKIKNIDKTKNGDYIVTFTSYKLGENSIKLGDKNLKFTIIPTIKENETAIYEKLSNRDNIYKEKEYPYLGIYGGEIGILAILLSIFLMIRDMFRNPFFIFKRDMRRVNSENWREKISFALRRCIDLNYNTNFLSGEYQPIAVLTDEDIEFIKKLDYLKFSLDKSGNVEQYKEKAKEIVKKIKKGDK